MAGKRTRLWRFEYEVGELGFSRIAGVDEAGRGPMAGPIVAGAVVLAHPVRGLNDSKLLTPEERERLYDRLMNGPHSIGWAIISSEEIDAMGLQQANYSAMLQAVLKLDPAPDYLLVDGFKIPGCPLPHLRIIKGDQRSQSIAAASIIAKVTRDRIMTEYEEQFPGYGFGKHKGYCTPEHFASLNTLGPSPIHRKCFSPVSGKLETEDLFGEYIEDVRQ